MKKFLNLMLVIAILVVSCFGIIGCNDGGDGETATGIVYKKYKGEDFYTVYDYVDDGVTTSLTIEGKDGIPVGRIAAGAFDGSSLQEIFVPTTVTEIGKGAFKNMKNLKQLTVPFIGKTALADAYNNQSSSATENKVFDAERTISHFFGEEAYEQGIKINNYYSAESSTSCYVPSTLTNIYLIPAEDYAIPMYAFSGFVNLSTLKFNSNVTAIGNGAFKGCISLKNIEIGSGVKSIGDDAFSSCAMLDTSVFFSKATALETIGDSAFANTVLDSVVLPATVKELGKECFKGSQIKNITLSKDLTYIGVEAFSGCEYLAQVNATACTAKVALGNFAFVDCVKLKNTGIDLTKFTFAPNCFMDSGVTLN